MKKLNNQIGLTPIIFLIIGGVIVAGSAIFVIFHQNSPTNTITNYVPSPAASQIASPLTTPQATAQPTAKSPTPKPTAKTSPSTNPNSSSNPSPTNNVSSAPNPTSTPSPTPQQYSTESFSNNGISVGFSCFNNGTLGLSGNVSVPSNMLIFDDKQRGVWGEIVDNSTGSKMMYVFIGLSSNYPANIGASIPPVGAIRGSTIPIIGDNRSYSAKFYYAAYTNSYPSVGDPIAQVDFHKTCP